MTETEWLNSADPHAMLAIVADKKPGPIWSWLSWLGIRGKQFPSRKSLLFAVACCRRIENLLADERSRYALAIAEKHADGQASRRERRLAKAAAAAAAFDANGPQIGVGGWLAAAQARAADAVAHVFDDEDPANCAAASVREAIRARTKGDFQSGQPPSKDSTWIVTSFCSSPARADEPVPAVPPEQTAWNDAGKTQCEYIRDLFGNPFQQATPNKTMLQFPNAIALAKSIYDECSFSRLPELADALCAEGGEIPEVLAHCREPREHIRGCWVIDWLLGK